MLQITIPAMELWDERKSEFIYRKEQTLQLEHSLVSLSKWERKWHKPFLGKTKKTDEETIDYVKCMTITQNVDPETYTYLTDDNLKQIYEYIENPMTATTFSETKSKGKSMTVTSEVIYYWMIASNIPFECQKWHLNTLLTLIRTCGVMGSPAKKSSNRELMSQHAAINAANRKRFRSKG